MQNALLKNSMRRLNAQLEIGESESGNFPAGPRLNLRCSRTTPDRPGSSVLQLLTREMAPMSASVRCCHNSQARCCGYTPRMQPPTEECVGFFSFCAAFEKKLTRHGAVTAAPRGNVAAPGEEKKTSVVMRGTPQLLHMTAAVVSNCRVVHSALDSRAYVTPQFSCS
jgi:hypothetical protein